MRMSHVMLSKGFGGAERHFVDLTLEMAMRGHDVQAICHRDFDAASEFAGVANLCVEAIAVMGTWDIWAARRISRLISLFRSEVVHAHLARAAHLSARGAREQRIRLVTNTHNYVNLKYYRAVDAFVVPTIRQQRYLIQAGIADDRVSLIPHFCRAPLNTERRARHGALFASLGRMVAKKGFDVLIKACGILRAQGLDARLRLGGAGIELERLRTLARECGMQHHVEFVGWVDCVAEFLQRADIFVLPSRDEPFGIVLLEAMAAGLPIVSTRTDGANEIFSEESAYLVDVGDAPALAKAMGFAFTERVESDRRASNAQALYRSMYSAEVVVPQYEALYESLGH